MESSGMFLLQQSDHHSSYFEVFRDLRKSEELFDFSIGCENNVIEAHKIILSACSPFFRQVLEKIKQTHPFIYLKDVMYEDLKAIVDYVYAGETKVASANLDRFFEVAKELKVHGLYTENDQYQVFQYKESTDDLEENPIESNVEPNNIKTDSDNTESYIDDSIKSEMTEEANSSLDGSFDMMALEEMESDKNTENSDDLSRATEVKSPLKSDNSFSNRANSNSPWKGETSTSQMKRLKEEVSKRLEKIIGAGGERLWKCTECGKEMASKQKIEYHVDTHLEGFTHHCKICEKPYKTRGALSVHMSLTHRKSK